MRSALAQRGLARYYGGTAVDIRGNPIGSLIPTDFKGVAIDPNNPPRFESQAAFLKRQGLFLAGEERRLRKVDYEPETIRRTGVRGRFSAAPWPSIQSTLRCSERGQVGPCLTVRSIGRSRNAVRVFSRYAIPRTLKQRSLRQALQVESSYLLCSRPTPLLAYMQAVAS